MSEITHEVIEIENLRQRVGLLDIAYNGVSAFIAWRNNRQEGQLDQAPIGSPYPAQEV